MPRAKSLPEMLAYEAKRRPDVAALMERAADMTEAEIDAAKVPLPWFRKALKIVRSEELRKRELNRTDLEDMLRFGINKDPVGHMFRYIGGEEFMEVDCASGLMTRSSLQVKTGALVWFPMDGGVWIDTIFSLHIDPKFAQSTAIKYVTRSDYQAAVREQRNNSHNLPPEQEFDPDDRGLFRIQRH